MTRADAPRGLAVLVGLALWLAGPPATAQPPEPPPAAAAAGAAPPAVPAAIPGSEVADRAQEESRRASEVRERAKASPAIAEIESQLVASAEEVAGLAATTRERLASAAISRLELERETFDFERLRERLAGWSATLTARAEALDADLALMESRRQTWMATRERAVAESQASAVTERIAKTLAAIDRAERATRAQRNAVLTLRESVARQQSTVDEVLDRVRARREQRRQELFIIESPPLWEALAAPTPSQGSLLERMRQARANDRTDLALFAREGKVQIALFLGLIAAAVLAAVHLRAPAMRIAAEDPALAAPARILERPIAAGMIVAMMAGAPLVTKPPPLVVGLHSIVFLAAALRLLVVLVARELHPILYGLVAWYAVDRLRDRLVPDPIATRLVLLAASILAVAALLWLLRPARLSKIGELARRPGRLRAIGLGMRIAIVLNLVAIASNVLGNALLAEAIVEGTLAAALLGFGLYAVSRVLAGAWALWLRSAPARSLRMVRNHGPLLQKRGRKLIRVGLTVAWVYASLRAFDAADPVLAAFGRALGAQWTLGGLTLSLGGVLGFVLMIAASIAIARFVHFALEEDLLARASLPRGVPFAISTLVRYAVLLIGFSMAVLAAGFDMSRLALMIGALGVGVGIGLQDIVNNVVSGLILLFERPVQVGDTVELGALRGEVRRIGIRSSTVRTFDGAEVVIPNSKLVSESFVNWTLSDRQRRIEIPVGVAYGCDPDRVIEVLSGAVRGRPEVLTEPPAAVLFDGFGESSLNFVVRAWAPDFDASRVLQSQLGLDIQRALREAGIEIPFPQRDLHLRSIDPALRAPLEGPTASGDSPATRPRSG